MTVGCRSHIFPHNHSHTHVHTAAVVPTGGRKETSGLWTLWISREYLLGDSFSVVISVFFCINNKTHSSSFVFLLIYSICRPFFYFVTRFDPSTRRFALPARLHQPLSSRAVECDNGVCFLCIKRHYHTK